MELCFNFNTMYINIHPLIILMFCGAKANYIFNDNFPLDVLHPLMVMRDNVIREVPRKNVHQ